MINFKSYLIEDELILQYKVKKTYRETQNKNKLASPGLEPETFSVLD